MIGLAFVLAGLLWVHSRSSQKVAREAVARWAGTHGYKVQRLKLVRGLARFLASFRVRLGGDQKLYRVVVATEKRARAEGWLVVGNPFLPCLTAERCPVRVVWSETQAVDGKLGASGKPGDSPMWDEALDR